MTNSPVSLMLRAVSFIDPSPLCCGQIISVGGCGATIWKKLNGARLVMPEADIVDTHATGRGAIVEAIQKYAVRRSMTLKSISIELPALG